MDVDEQTGWWCLPGREDRRVPGVLTFDVERGGKLTLIGGLVEVEEVATAVTRNGETSMAIGEDEIEAAGTYDRVLGIVDRKPVTLEHCIEVHRSGGLFAATTKQIIRVGRILHGAQFGSGEAGGDGLQVGLDWLTEWTQRSGVTGNVKIKEGQETLYTMEGRRLPTDWIELEGGGRLGLHHSIRAEMDVTAPALEQTFQFELDYPDVRTADELIDVASDLQDLISIGTGRTAAFKRLVLFHPDVYQETPAGRWHKPIAVHAQWPAESTQRSGRWSNHEAYFGLEDLGGMPGVAKWLIVARKHRETLGKVMATRYAASMYVTDRYYNRVASLEDLNRKEAGDGNQTVSLNRRLTRCAQLAGQPFANLVAHVDEWVKIVKSDRDDIGHHFGRRQSQHTLEQFYLSESTYWLYVLCLLRLADAPDAVFAQIAGNYQFEGLARRLAKFIPPPGTP
ncbi:hypothetical protein [Micromonospora globbae]|uniref:ApeA N-terminal domain-containing protein n=1 Tax=Micromonospora globbae TaxID=1894969 RepID=A0A420EV96_9ACTN|nr:hypothetical protein [Micromonospora globbae]RKF24642.1 hypothetical protein D7I43_25000 [Micromonospora globbae]